MKLIHASEYERHEKFPHFFPDCLELRPLETLLFYDLISLKAFISFLFFLFHLFFDNNLFSKVKINEFNLIKRSIFFKVHKKIQGGKMGCKLEFFKSILLSMQYFIMLGVSVAHRYGNWLGIGGLRVQILALQATFDPSCHKIQKKHSSQKKICLHDIGSLDATAKKLLIKSRSVHYRAAC